MKCKSGGSQARHGSLFWVVVTALLTWSAGSASAADAAFTRWLEQLYPAAQQLGVIARDVRRRDART